jgi:hypothetical protein
MEATRAFVNVSRHVQLLPTELQFRHVSHNLVTIMRQGLSLPQIGLGLRYAI